MVHEESGTFPSDSTYSLHMMTLSQLQLMAAEILKQVLQRIQSSLMPAISAQTVKTKEYSAISKTANTVSATPVHVLLEGSLKILKLAQGETVMYCPADISDPPKFHGSRNVDAFG